MVTTDPPVLLYDGVCALCNGAVRFVLAHDRSRTIRFAALDSAFARCVIARHPGLRNADSLVFVEPPFGDARVAVRSEAILRVAARMGGPWRAAALLRILPRAVRDASYDLVARSRYRVFGKLDSCPRPPADARHRFIEREG